MCGIIAWWGYTDATAPIDRNAFLAARDSMAARGPDAAGHWQDDQGTLHLGHRRLAIIDLDRAADQPMVTVDGRLRIVFNGEIYNYQDLRRDLIDQGAVFRTHSDTEVILELYRRQGPDSMRLLRGMFALVIWDHEANTLFMARDPFGIKPLYVWDDGTTCAAASQVTALRGLLGDQLTSDPSAHLGFFLTGSVPDPLTMFREVRAIPAGSWLLRTRDGVETGTYFDPARIVAEAQDTPIPDQDRAHYVQEALADSIAAHRIADVEVGVFLSAGVDSTLLSWLALRQDTGGDPLRGLTIAGREAQGTPFDEIPLAREFAERVGMRHDTHYLDRRDFGHALDDIIAAMDQPSIDGVNSYFVSIAAAQAGLKVALSGLGGDELFAGYPSFTHVPRLARLGPGGALGRWLGTGMRHLTAPVAGRFTSPKYASLLEYAGSYARAYFLRRALFMPWEIRLRDGRSMSREEVAPMVSFGVSDGDLAPIRSDQARVSLLEITRYMRCQLLRDSDWAGMASSLEIRVPFVDATLFRQLAPVIATGPALTKDQVALAAGHPMQHEIVERAKTGFSLPVREWLLEDSGQAGRGLRGWAGHVYERWCARHGCAPMIDTSHLPVGRSAAAGGP